MFGRKIDPEERQKALELLVRWSEAITKMDAATDTMRFTMVEQPMGMQSEEYEETRLSAIAVVKQVKTETVSPQFWPILEDNNGAKTIIELKMKLDESYGHQLNLLNLYSIAREAFRSGRDYQAPSLKEMKSANKSFARVLDEMGKIASRLARHYQISLKEYQRQLLR